MRKDLDKIQWCPWCWAYLILASIRKVLTNLSIDPKDVVIVSWIWCSWKISHYINAYAAETLHGRTIPFATWVKLSNPNLKVIAIWWDWDWYGIWVWHFMHACRRNIDITYIVLNNENYGLTTGQASPTTPIGAKTSSTPAGNLIKPFDPVALAKAWGCDFSCQIDGADIKLTQQTIQDAILFNWFSHIDIKQRCPSWKKW